MSCAMYYILSLDIFKHSFRVDVRDGYEGTDKENYGAKALSSLHSYTLKTINNTIYFCLYDILFKL